MKRKIITLFIIYFHCSILSQEITGKIIHFLSNEALSDVAISTNINTGTISDKNGKFIISVKNVSSLTFSKLGFEPTTISIKNLEKLNYTIALKEAVTLLDEIALSIPKISLDSLLMKTTRSMKKNHILSPLKNSFLWNTAERFNFKNSKITLKHSSHFKGNIKKHAKKTLDEFADKIEKGKFNILHSYSGIVEHINSTSKKDNKKFLSTKPDSLIGYKPEINNTPFSLETQRKELTTLILKFLDTNKTYKVKSGLFKIEDSVSLKKTTQHKNSLTNNTFNSFKILDYLSEANKIRLFYTKEDENNFMNPKYYKFKLLQNEFLKSGNSYVVEFKPKKSKAKHQGKIYINPKDFGITKVEYQYAKGKKGEYLNLKLLLGVKHAKRANFGKIIYEKNMNNNYYLAYWKDSVESYTYANRPFKFRENSEKKNKLKIAIKFEAIVSEINEIYFYNVSLKKEHKFLSSVDKDFFLKKIPFSNNREILKKLEKEQEKLVHFLKNKE